ncbi:MAG: hypothetical protein ACR2L6_07395 [Gemmatimonadaceae bacterium]
MIFDELKAFRIKLNGFAESPVFSLRPDSRKPVDTTFLARALLKAEAEAGLPKLSGTLFHAYRRTWATARKGYPTKDVAAAGRWSNESMVLVYQQAEESVIEEVMNATRKVLGAGNG